MKVMAYVYIIQCRDKFKIGYSSKHPKSRLKSMTTGNPYELKIIRMYKQGERPEYTRAEVFERQMHNKYNEKRCRGEWFDLTLKDISDIDFLADTKNYTTEKFPLLETNLYPHAESERTEYWQLEYKKQVIINKTLKTRLQEKTDRCINLLGRSNKLQFEVENLNANMRSNIQGEHIRVIDQLIDHLEFLKKA